MPIFEGLFPAPHEKIVQDVLYLAATLHAYCKLRLHTDATVTSQYKILVRFGNAMRKFKAACDTLLSTETDQEYHKRMNRQVRQKTFQEGGPDRRTKLEKVFSLNTVKFHDLGDYILTILRLGTTDSYTTAIVCYVLRRLKCTANKHG